MKRSHLLPFSLCALALFAIVHDSSATIRRVPSQYPAIQLAIDASVNGDTVLVTDGTYYENIRFKGKRIVVASTYLTTNDTSHIQNTIIDGSHATNPDSGSVVYFNAGEDTNSVLCGFTITGGSGTNWYLVQDGWYREGGGIFCESGAARIVRNIITRNRIQGSTADGAGVWAVNTTTSLPYLILERNLITDNIARADSLGVGVTAGGAVLFSISARIIGNVFERDTAVSKWYASGAGLAFQGFPQGPYPLGFIQGNIFRDNIASTVLRGAFGGGMVVEHTGPVTISDNLFEGNVAVSANSLGHGGGLWIGDAYLPGTTAPARKLIVRNRFLRNRTQGTDWGTGGGIELDGTVATITQNEISENTAVGTYYGGGGIWAIRSAFRIENNIIVRNHASAGGGGVAARDVAGRHPRRVPAGGRHVVRLRGHLDLPGEPHQRRCAPGAGGRVDGLGGVRPRQRDPRPRRRALRGPAVAPPGTPPPSGSSSRRAAHSPSRWRRWSRGRRWSRCARLSFPASATLLPSITSVALCPS